jgi:hypothetical protein
MVSSFCRGSGEFRRRAWHGSYYGLLGRRGQCLGRIQNSLELLSQLSNVSLYARDLGEKAAHVYAFQRMIVEASFAMLSVETVMLGSFCSCVALAAIGSQLG